MNKEVISMRQEDDGRFARWLVLAMALPIAILILSHRIALAKEGPQSHPLSQTNTWTGSAGPVAHEVGLSRRLILAVVVVIVLVAAGVVVVVLVGIRRRLTVAGSGIGRAQSRLDELERQMRWRSEATAAPKPESVAPPVGPRSTSLPSGIGDLQTRMREFEERLEAVSRPARPAELPELVDGFAKGMVQEALAASLARAKARAMSPADLEQHRLAVKEFEVRMAPFCGCLSAVAERIDVFLKGLPEAPDAAAAHLDKIRQIGDKFRALAAWGGSSRKPALEGSQGVADREGAALAVPGFSAFTKKALGDAVGKADGPDLADVLGQYLARVGDYLKGKAEDIRLQYPVVASPADERAQMESMFKRRYHDEMLSLISDHLMAAESLGRTMASALQPDVVRRLSYALRYIKDELLKYISLLDLELLDIEIGKTSFNAIVHESVDREVTTEYPDGTIVGVLQHGFKKKSGEVVRRPRVIVSRTRA